MRGLRVCVEEPAGAVLRVGTNPDGGLLTAAVSIWLPNYDDRGPHEEVLARAGAATFGWIVAESEALAYGEHRTWPDGQRSPGMSITTFFDKRPGLSDEDFYRIWHGEHTPLSFEIHPFWLYVRNQVLRAVTPEAPPVRGIVYEAVRTDEDMLDLTRFFGCPEQPDLLGTRIRRVNDHMGTFGDVGTLQCSPMREWIFRTVST